MKKEVEPFVAPKVRDSFPFLSRLKDYREGEKEFLITVERGVKKDRERLKYLVKAKTIGEAEDALKQEGGLFRVIAFREITKKVERIS